MKQILTLLLAVVLCLSLFACATPTDNTPESTQETVTKTPVVEEHICKFETDNNSIQNFKTHGRTTLTKGGLVCDLSASGIELNAYIEGSISVELYVTAECYFTLYIDGIRSQDRIKVSEGSKTIELANFAEGGVHNIKLIKQTESNRALCNLKEVEFKGYFEVTPEDKNLYIEFIGDSITAGYGNLCANGTANPGSALNQDATKAYAYLTAEALNADYSLVCCSGIGLAKGYTEYTMDSFFKAASYHRSQKEAFTATRTPDLIVINLGTNDNSKGSTHAELADKVPELINLIRTTYGKEIPIIWVHGMMGEGKWANIEHLIKTEFGGESGGIYSLEITRNAQGGGSHPSSEAHISAAEVLVKFIKDKGLNK